MPVGVAASIRPKWTSTTYTLLTLRDIGIPRDHLPAQRAAALVLDKQLGCARDDAFMLKLFVLFFSDLQLLRLHD